MAHSCGWCSACSEIHNADGRTFLSEASGAANSAIPMPFRRGRMRRRGAPLQELSHRGIVRSGKSNVARSSAAARRHCQGRRNALVAPRRGIPPRRHYITVRPRAQSAARSPTAAGDAADAEAGSHRRGRRRFAVHSRGASAPPGSPGGAQDRRFHTRPRVKCKFVKLHVCGSS